MGELEGLWWGPDKVAHFLFPIAVTGWAAALHRRWAKVWWIGSILLTGVWELSNRWAVLSGFTGISILDFQGFLLGGFVAGLLLWRAR